MTSSEMHQWLWTITRGIGGTQNCGGKKLDAHCKEKKSVSQSSTHRQPIEKDDNAWSTTAGQT